MRGFFCKYYFFFSESCLSYSVKSVMGFLATPLSTAAFATAVDTLENNLLSKGFGMKYSRPNSN